MKHKSALFGTDGVVILLILLLSTVSAVVLRAISPSLFPSYYIYYGVTALAFYLLWKIDFDILALFSKHAYILSIILLIFPLLIGQVTRGAIRWIPIGNVSFQPSEIVRPFLFLYFSQYLIRDEISVSHLIKSFVIFMIPFILIIIAPSLGVALLTAIGFLGVILASSINKRQIFLISVLGLALLPAVWFLLAPYQKQRISGFLNPQQDPLGVGYNSIQSMISVGSGGLFGRGLGKGVQTQLSFLPERHTDFIFASIAEELGFIGAILVLVILFILFVMFTKFIENAKTPQARAFISAFTLSLLAQTFIHLGMNMGLLPITGVPLPFVSAGGSALLGTAVSLALVLNAKK